MKDSGGGILAEVKAGCRERGGRIYRRDEFIEDVASIKVTEDMAL